MFRFLLCMRPRTEAESYTSLAISLNAAITAVCLSLNYPKMFNDERSSFSSPVFYALSPRPPYLLAAAISLPEPPSTSATNGIGRVCSILGSSML